MSFAVFSLYLLTSIGWAGPCARVVPDDVVDWPQIRLLDAGSTPREPLRVQLEVGDVQRRRMEMDVSMAQIVEEGLVQAVPLPLLVFELETRVESILPSGIAEVSYRYLTSDALPAPGVPELVLEATREPLRSMAGLSGSYLLSDCLYTDVISAALPPAIDENVMAQLQDMEEGIGLFSDPLPDEAVGPGARWEVRWLRVENQVRITQKTVYELISRDENQAVLSVELSQAADAQTISPRELPDAVVQLIYLESTGSGSITLDLSAPLPAQAQQELSTEQRLGVDTGPGEVIQTQQIHTRTRLVSVEN